MNNLITTAQAILTLTPDKWTRLCQTLPEELLSRPAAPGQWSALECLHHLTATEAVFSYRLDCFLEGCREFPDYDPESVDERIDPASTPASLSGEFNQRRSASLKTLAQVTETDLSRRARHAELGPVTLAELLHEWAAHDLNHTIQAERALMQPLILGSGPWQPYFSDHLLAQGA